MVCFNGISMAFRCPVLVPYTASVKRFCIISVPVLVPNTASVITPWGNNNLMHSDFFGSLYTFLKCEAKMLTFFGSLLNWISQVQESIPVGCVPPPCIPYVLQWPPPDIVLGGSQVWCPCRPPDVSRRERGGGTLPELPYHVTYVFIDLFITARQRSYG